MKRHFGTAAKALCGRVPNQRTMKAQETTCFACARRLTRTSEVFA